MSTKVQECCRCGKRHREQSGWNQDFIAGMVVGVICPGCQTSEDHIEAEVNLALDPAKDRRELNPTDDDGWERVIYGLIDTYPTAEKMRAEADRLSAARKDTNASTIVRLMRDLAGEMESGGLWDEGESGSNLAAACDQCGRSRPNTADELTGWGLVRNPLTGQDIGTRCPTCLEHR
jgi:hypothetical protein